MNGTMKRSVALGAAGLLAGSLLGVGTFALWRAFDEVPVAELRYGAEHFAVNGQAANTAYGEKVAGHAVQATVDGPGLAQQVLDHGRGAQPFLVEGYSQGNKGIRYTVERPADWWAAGTLLEGAETTFWRVNDAAECTRDATPPGDETTFTWPLGTADYTDSTAPASETWCILVAKEAGGVYTNTGSATATWTDSEGNVTEVTAEPGPDGNTWNAVVTSDLDPADQNEPTIGFSYETHRPGA